VELGMKVLQFEESEFAELLIVHAGLTC
jgi:hypothetical protein